MPKTLFLKRKLNGLYANDALSEELLHGFPPGEVVKAVITRPRHPEHHAKWMALVNCVFDAQDTYPTMDAFHGALKVALGHGETVKLPDGRLMLIPGSISFAKLSQDSFQEFYDRAVKFIIEHVIPGLDSADLEREVNDILEGKGNQ